MQKNEEIILEITDVTNTGSGVGKIDGMAVFVPLTAVGDKCKVKILKVKKNYAYGKLIEIINPSADRIENDCGSFNKCGGCSFRHISYNAECFLKKKQVYEIIKRIGGVDLKPEGFIASDCPDRYRNKAQYPISSAGGVGFFAFHSHRIIECDDCKLQPEIFAGITKCCSEFIKSNSISVYNEEKHSGLLRHIYVRNAEMTGEIMVCIVINGDSLPFAERLIDALKKVCGEKLVSVQININKEKTNVILGKQCSVLYGEKYIIDVLCGVKVRLSPLSFYQVNRKTAELLYKKAGEYANADGKDIIDLYCGAGTIGLSLARQAKSVTGVEIVPQAVEDAKFNAELNGITNADFLCADAAEAAERFSETGKRADVIVVDPPRKGLDEKLIDIITWDFAPERVVYVSCDPATLARDIKIFGEKGYCLKKYTPVDMFPRTSHVETVALLSRASV